MKTHPFKPYISKATRKLLVGTLPHAKEDNHDRWLDNLVEDKLQQAPYRYDRNVKRLQTNAGSVNIDIVGLGEIDFIIIAANIKKVFITDCKHLLGRYDMVNQKNDYNAFAVGSSKNKPYNATMNTKLNWFKGNVHVLEEHFQKKYNDPKFSLYGFDIEGMFIVNSPTFYMYNADIRIYTLDQVDAVWAGTYVDPTFVVYVDNEDTESFLNVKYPYFRRPMYVYFDPSYDDDTADEKE